MGMFVNTNVSAINAQRNITKTGRDFSTTYQRLSSGLRINSAKDDAAGLSITTRMAAQIRGYGSATRNINDGISLAQTAEGALQESTNILQRMRELAVQAANDMNTSADRESINAEVTQLKAELDRIGETTTFNTHNILNGRFIQKFVHVGSNANETVNMSIRDARSAALGRSALTKTASVTTHAFSKAAGDVTINLITIRNTTNADDTLSTSFRTGSAIAKAAAINDASEHTKVVARVMETKVEDSQNVTAGALDEDSFLRLNGVIITGFDVQNDDSDSELLSQINAVAADTGVVATRDADYQLVLTAVDGRNIEVFCSDGDAETITGLSTKVYLAEVELESATSFDVAGANLQYLGFANNQTIGVNSSNSVSTVDTSTRQNANRMIQVLDRALEQVSEDRSGLGALQNRLESTLNNVANISENLSASKSRILDADFAKESTNLSRQSVLQQAATSILAQANQQSQSALSLLQ